MNRNHLRLSSAVAAAGIAVALLGGCSSSTKAPDEPVLPDISTPENAVRALEDAYGERNLENALYLHHEDFRYFPDPSANVSFLEPGETSWDLDRETGILERLLVPERISWLDQVLLEITRSDIADSAGSPDIVIYRSEAADLVLAQGGTRLFSGRSDLELVYLRDGNGNHFLLQVRESSPAAAGDGEVSEAKAFVESPPSVNTTSADPVNAVVATLNGTVNAHGLQTTVWFEWGLDTSYGNVTPNQDGGMGVGAPVPYAVTLNVLAPATEYHYRIVASSAWGTSRGNDITFTTIP